VTPEAPPSAAPAATATTTASATPGFWDEDDGIDPGPSELPDPALELEAGRSALVAGDPSEAAFRFALALRLAPALAPAVLEATAGARDANLMMVRGDAYRLAGAEADAREAYATAATGGLPERRHVSRARPKAKVTRVARVDGAGGSVETIGVDDLLETMGPDAQGEHAPGEAVLGETAAMAGGDPTPDTGTLPGRAEGESPLPGDVPRDAARDEPSA
jgi:hypothetical protein